MRCLIISLLIFVSSLARAQNPGNLPFQALITNTSDVALTNTTFTGGTALVIEILDTVNQCVVYKESVPTITTDGKGLVSWPIGTGTTTFATGAPATIQGILTGPSFTTTGTGCLPGTTASGSLLPVNSGDIRAIQFSVDNGTTWSTATTVSIGSVPYAFNADSLGNIPAANYLQNTSGNGLTLTSGAASDASALHNHDTHNDARYAQIGGAGGQNFTAATINATNETLTGQIGIGLAPAASVDIEKATPATIIIGSTGAAGNTMSLNFDSSTRGTTNAQITATDNANILTFKTGGATAMTLNANQTVNFASTITSAGAIGTSAYLSLGQYTTGTEPVLAAALKGSMWENTTTQAIRFWDGTSNQTLLEGVTAGNGVTVTAVSPSSPTVSVNYGTAANTAVQGNQAFSGDVTGSFLAGQTVAGLQTIPVSNTAPTINQVLTYNGTKWIGAPTGPATPAGATTQIQYNNAGVLAASSNFTVDNTNYVLTIDTTNAPVGDALIIPQNPSNLAVKSLVRLGPLDIAGGSGTGTYLGANSATATSDFINMQANSVNKFLVDKNGNVNAAGTVTAPSFSGSGALLTGITPTFAGLTPGGISYATTPTNMSSMASAGLTGQALISSGGGAPTWSTVTLSGGNVNLPAAGNITNAAGALNISATTNLILQSVAGEVGIGTTTPGGELEVDSSVNTVVPLVVKSPGTTTVDLADWYVNGVLKYGINNTGTPSLTTDLVSKAYSDLTATNLGTNYLRKDGTTPLTANWNMGGFQVSNIAQIGVGNALPGAMLDIGSPGTTLGTLRLEGNTSGYVQLQSSAAAGSWTMTLPPNTGAAGNFLQTNGAGVTSWVAAGAASLSSLTGATVADTVPNTNFAQTWTWNGMTTSTALTLSSNSITSGSLLALTESNATATGSTVNISDAGTGTALKVSNTGTGLAATFTGGYVGIGTTTPAGTLDVEGGTATAGNGSQVRLVAQSGFTTGNTNGGNIVLQPGAGNGTGTGGNVGVWQGVTSNSMNTYFSTNEFPLAPVAGGNFAPGLLVYGSGTYNYGIDIGSSGGRNRTRIFAPGQGGGGNADIAFSFHLAGTAPTSQNSLSDAMVIRGDTGNVGIGTTAPAALLDVAGTINTSAKYQLNGTTFLGGDTASNVFVGGFAGPAISSGNGDTFVGDYAGNATTTGSSNTFMGNNAGYSNTTGFNNTYVGTSTGFNGTAASNNTIIGAQAASSAAYAGSDNVIIGTQAGSAITGSNYDTLVGFQAGTALSTGADNTLIGYLSGARMTTSANNTVIGYEAGYNLTTGAGSNTLIGYLAGTSITTGDSNTIVGYQAGQSFSGAGTGANSFFGLSAGKNDTTGNNNTNLGYQAGVSVTTGSNDVFVGTNSDSGFGGVSNSVAIGYNSTTQASTSIAIGQGALISGAASVGSIALGTGAHVTASNATQIGTGTNSNAGTVQVGTQMIVDPNYNLHGANLGVYVGNTNFTLNFPVYTAARAACQAAYPNPAAPAHICTADELLISAQQGQTPTANAFFASGPASASFDCAGFTSAAGSSPVWQTSGKFNTQGCTGVVALACCQ